MKVSLHLHSTERAARIIELELPGFSVAPQVLICGSQVFTRLADTRVYHEASSYAILEPLDRGGAVAFEVNAREKTFRAAA